MNNPSDEEIARIEKKFLAAYANGRKPKPLELPPPNPKVLSWIDEAVGCGFGLPSEEEQRRMQRDRDVAYIEMLLLHGEITVEQARQHMEDPAVIRSWREAAQPYVTAVQKLLDLGIFTPAQCQSTISRLLSEKLLTMADLTPKLRDVFFARPERYEKHCPVIALQPGSLFMNTQYSSLITVQNNSKMPLQVKFELTFGPLPEESSSPGDQEQPTLCGFPLVFSDKTPTLGDLQIGDFSSYKMPVFSIVEEPVDSNCKIRSPITCPRDHHTMPDPCRRDYCSCSCDFCKQSCGETPS